MNIELGRIADDVENTDSLNLTNMGLMLYDIDHKIMILPTFFHYTLKELEENFKETQIIKDRCFDLIVKTEE